MRQCHAALLLVLASKMSLSHRRDARNSQPPHATRAKGFCLVANTSVPWLLWRSCLGEKESKIQPGVDRNGQDGAFPACQANPDLGKFALAQAGILH